MFGYHSASRNAIFKASCIILLNILFVSVVYAENSLDWSTISAEEQSQSYAMGMVSPPAERNERFVRSSRLISFPDRIADISGIELLQDRQTGRLIYGANRRFDRDVSVTTVEDLSITRSGRGSVSIGGVIRAENDQPRGQVHIVETRNGYLAGSISLDDISYRILPSENPGQAYIQEIDRNILNAQFPDGCQSEQSPSVVDRALVDESPEVEVAASSSASEIDMLVLFTPAAKQRLGGGANGMEAIADLLSEEINQAYQNSEISGVSIDVVGVTEYDYEEIGDTQQDLYSYRTDPVVRQLRDRYSADIVHLVVADVGYGSCGRAATLSLQPGRAYALSVDSCLNAPQYTGVHEVGHLHGAQHHPDDPVNSNPYYNRAYGHRYQITNMYPGPRFETTDYSTVMAYKPNGEQRSLRFSNPDVVLYEALGFEVPTGTSWRNNADAIRDSASIIAGWRDSGSDSGGSGCSPATGPCCDPVTGICYEPY